MIQPVITQRLYGIHILIINHNKQVVGLLNNMLNHIGFTNIHIAQDGFHAMQLLREYKIHLVIMDYDLRVLNPMMQDKALALSGDKFAQRLRHARNSPCPYVPIIMLSANMALGKWRQSCDAGINEICIKPVQAKDLMRKIRHVIDKPKMFITSEQYKGPCRRRRKSSPEQERRFAEIRIIPYRSVA